MMAAFWGALAALAAAGCTQAESETPPVGADWTDYSLRDGAAEAEADARARRPLKIYSAVFNGFIPGYRSPGLAYCDPQTVSQAGMFVVMPEAAFAEGEPPPADPEARRKAYTAGIFARDYNHAVLRTRAPELLTACPKVSRTEGT